CRSKMKLWLTVLLLAGLSATNALKQADLASMLNCPPCKTNDFRANLCTVARDACVKSEKVNENLCGQA
ncbi:hypothetical protein BGX20_004441, partial [Mortierella sp. AD010]